MADEEARKLWRRLQHGAQCERRAGLVLFRRSAAGRRLHESVGRGAPPGGRGQGQGLPALCGAAFRLSETARIVDRGHFAEAGRCTPSCLSSRASSLLDDDERAQWHAVSAANVTALGAALRAPRKRAARSGWRCTATRSRPTARCSSSLRRPPATRRSSSCATSSKRRARRCSARSTPVLAHPRLRDAAARVAVGRRAVRRRARARGAHRGQLDGGAAGGSPARRHAAAQRGGRGGGGGRGAARCQLTRVGSRATRSG